MKLKGTFELVWEQKKEGSNWVNIYGEFAVSGERDLIRVNIPHTKDWCLENGLKTGASGEINISFRKELGRDGETTYYTQKVWEFKTTEQLLKEKEERQQRREERRAMRSAIEKTDEMQAAADAMMEKAKEENAADPEASENLPF